MIMLTCITALAYLALLDINVRQILTNAVAYHASMAEYAKTWSIIITVHVSLVILEFIARKM